MTTPSYIPRPEQVPNASWDDVPGGDIPLDELFADPSPEPPAQVPSPAQPSRPFLSAGQTVYNTADEAARGVQHKDAIIAKLREEIKKHTGVDPITGKAISSPVSGTPTEEKLFDRVVKAVDIARQTGDTSLYEKAMSEFVDKRVNEVLAPYAPVIVDTAKERAVSSVAATKPGIREFLSSETYKAGKETLPSLYQAIANAEADPRFAWQLPELYSIVFDVNLGRRASSAPADAPPATPSQRPTLTPSTPAPPTQGVAAPDLRSVEGLRAYIKEMEQRGMGGAKIISS